VRIVWTRVWRGRIAANVGGMSQPCPACQGLRVTWHTDHTLELDERGDQVPVTRSYTAQCSMCHGSGEAE
jgi:hypothetical protein